MKKKNIYLGLTLIAPGVAQFAMKRYIRGCVLFLAGIICFLWIIVDILTPIYCGVMNLINQISNDDLMNYFAWSRMLIVLICLVLFWIWSIVDVIFLYNDKSREGEDVV